jgi:CMP-N-acetylneuraminic acid synthetase
MILAVIPARSGSKSVKDKNIRPLAGQHIYLKLKDLCLSLSFLIK